MKYFKLYLIVINLNNNTLEIYKEYLIKCEDEIERVAAHNMKTSFIIKNEKETETTNKCPC